MKIQFNDINGNVLNTGDWVAVSHTRNVNILDSEKRILTFYVQVRVIDGKIQPFDNFCFNQIHKINFNDIPKEAIHAEAGNYYTMHKGAKAELQDKIDEYMNSWLRFELNRKFYTITEGAL